MKNRVETYDWSDTPLGSISQWPETLKVAYQIIMRSRFPMFIWWGPELINIYNDAYAPMLGKRHPEALGRPAAEVWYEIWDIVGKQANLVIEQGQSTWSEEMLLVMERYGYTEEAYFTYSYSPIGAAGQRAAGLFCAVTEDTSKVIGGRRLKTLRELAAETANLRSAAEVFRAATEVIGRNPYDIPFALLYEIHPERNLATLAGTVGMDEGTNGAPLQVGLDAEANPWRLDLRSEKIQRVGDLQRYFDEVPGGPWPVPPNEALILPFAKGAEGPERGFLFAGVSSYARLTDDYRGFLSLVAGHVASAVANSRAYEAERRRAEALAEVDRAKTAFFSNVSHEFRTPLTLLLGPLEDALANRHGILPMGAAASLATAHRNALRLLKLVNTLLDFARIEAERAQASYQPVDLAAFTADLASNFRSLCEKAGLQLHVHCTPLPADEPAYVDRDMWERIVLNLLSNAFKFTLKGEIEVKLEAAGGNAVLTVRDTGVGIPAEELPHMFERFHRVAHSQGRTNEGTGIGLALVQELVRIHGGTVGVEGVAGDGSTFRVSIPLGAAHLDLDRAAQPRAAPPGNLTSAAFIEEARRWLPDDPIPEVGTPDRTSASEPPEGRPFVIWADDNADMRTYVSRLLGGRCHVEAVADGEAALEAARQRIPDLILADVMMPRMDGFELLREIRADARLRGIPLVLLSARAGEEARIEGLQAGADDYLIKPFSSRELLAVVESHLKLSQFRRETTEALRTAYRNAQLLAAIVESSDDAIISKDLNGVITSWNRSAERLFGYTAEEAVGRSITILIPPERLDEEPKILAALRRGERVDHFETVRVRKDGTRLNISLTVSPVKDAHGRVTGASKVARDITEQVRQETALKQANADLQQFAYSASHDLQEPLRMLTIYSQLLERNFAERLGEQGKEFIRQVAESARRMDELLRDLRAYAQVSAANPGPPDELDAGEALSKALENLRALIVESGASIRVGDLPRVHMRAFQLEQIFQNLIGNAIRYRGSAPPSIEISAVRLGDEWRFAVKDNGIGIAPEFHQQIFCVFKRLHSSSEYPGTGMGLAICQRSVESAGGRIWVESEPGKGSTFYFTIPLREREKAA